MKPARTLPDVDRDPHLLAALRHAPDHGASPPAELSERILADARRAARPGRAAGAGWFESWFGWMSRPVAAGAFGTVMIAAFVGLMWREGPPPEAMPGADRIAQAPVAAPPSAPEPPAAAAAGEAPAATPTRPTAAPAAPPQPAMPPAAFPAAIDSPAPSRQAAKPSAAPEPPTPTPAARTDTLAAPGRSGNTTTDPAAETRAAEMRAAEQRADEKRANAMRSDEKVRSMASRPSLPDPSAAVDRAERAAVREASPTAGPATGSAVGTTQAAAPPPAPAPAAAPPAAAAPARPAARLGAAGADNPLAAALASLADAAEPATRERLAALSRRATGWTPSPPLAEGAGEPVVDRHGVVIGRLQIDGPTIVWQGRDGRAWRATLAAAP